MTEYEKSDLPPQSIQSDEVTVHRWSNYLTSQLSWEKRMKLIWTIYIQPRFDVTEDIRILNETEFAVELGQPLALVVTFRARYDSRPPLTIKSLDSRLETRLSISF